MKKMFSIGVAIALLTISGAVMAYPSLLGPTGSGVLPNDVTVNRGAFDAAIDYFNNGEGALNSSIIARVEYGVAENTEIGVGYTMQDVVYAPTQGATANDETTVTSYSYNNWSVNAKRTMTVNDRINAGLGVVYQSYNDLLPGDTRNFLQVYGLVGGTLPIAGIMPIQGTIGLNYTRGEANEANDSAIRGFVGLSAMLTEKLSLAVDFQTEDSYFDDKPLSSIVARYPITSRMNAQVGMSNAMLSIGGGKVHNFFAGVNMGFGGQ